MKTAVSTRDQLEERVKDIVRRQLEEQRRKSGSRTRFERATTTRLTSKVKRVMTDTGF
jgi:ribosomal protein L14